MKENISRQRYVFLDGLRGVAALAIVIHHFTQHSIGHRSVFSSAAIGVELFFCLSGFVLAYSYHERLIQGMALTLYAKKRLIRLYPMYFVGLVLGIIALVLLKIHGLTDFTWEAMTKASLLNLAFLPYLNSYDIQVFIDRIPGAIFPLNGPAWSLFFGLLANFFYAATIGVSRKIPFVLVAASSIGLYFATSALGEAPGWGTENFIGGFPRVFFSFFAGVLIFQLKDKFHFVPHIKPAYLILLVMLLLAVPRFDGHHAYWFVNAVILMPVLVICTVRCTIESNSVWHKVCTYFGRLSYPLYCVHFPLLMALSIFFSTAEHYALLMISSVVVSIAVAHVLMTRVEEPVRAWFGGKVVRAP